MKIKRNIQTILVMNKIICSLVTSVNWGTRIDPQPTKSKQARCSLLCPTGTSALLELDFRSTSPNGDVLPKQSSLDNTKISETKDTQDDTVSTR